MRMTPTLRTRLATVAALATLAPLAACTGENSLQDNGRTVVVQENTDPDALNPLTSDSMAAIDICSAIYEGLTNSDDHLHTYPVLAETIPTLENGGVTMAGKGMVVTWKLRKGVKWQDGAPFTADDVKFTQDMIMDKRTKIVTRQGFDKITQVEVLDPYTIRLTFKEVYAPYDLQYGAIFPKHLLQKYLDDPKADINKSPFNQHPVGTGPFKFKDSTAGDHVSLTAFKDYWHGVPKVDGVKFRIVPDQNAAFTLLKSGELDVYQNANINQYDALKKLKHVHVDPQAGLTWELLSFNLKKPLLQDVRVRQALYYAINKKQISKKIYQGLFPPAYSDQAPLSWAYNKDVESRYPYSPDKAKALLDAAGWKAGLDGMRSKNGQRLAIKVTTTTGQKSRELTEQVLRFYFKKVGVDLTIDNVPGSILFGPAPEGTLKGAKYDLAMYAWQAPPDPDNFSTWHSSQAPNDKEGNGQNTSFFSNREMDMLVTSGTRVVSHEARKKIYHRTAEILAEQVPVIPLLYWANLNPNNKRLLNFKPNPSSAGNMWNCSEWALDAHPVKAAASVPNLAVGVVPAASGGR